MISIETALAMAAAAFLLGAFFTSLLPQGGDDDGHPDCH